MKLRINGNSIRLRLSQKEVQSFKDAGSFSETIDFGYSALTYTLKNRQDIEEVSAVFENDVITIEVPQKIAVEWTETEMVGFNNDKIIEDCSEGLKILVEKDFQCLHKRPGENETDMFPNPMSEVKNP